MPNIKFPRIFHLPWSEGLQSDDKRVDAYAMNALSTKELVVLEKMDGENTTLTEDNCFARSLDSVDHPSRHWVKKLWGSLKYDLKGIRLHGENVYARHSVAYDNLDSYFMLFGVSDATTNAYYAWEDVQMVAAELSLITVPFIKFIQAGELSETVASVETSKQEGYVVRNVEAFMFSQESFNTNIAKYVRANHVQSDNHWMHSAVVPNGLK